MDPSTPMIDQGVFRYNSDWVKFYGGVAEEDPPLMSEPLGEPVPTSFFLTLTMIQMFSLGYHIQVYYCLFPMVKSSL